MYKLKGKNRDYRQCRHRNFKKGNIWLRSNDTLSQYAFIHASVVKKILIHIHERDPLICPGTFTVCVTQIWPQRTTFYFSQVDSTRRIFFAVLIKHFR